MIAPPRWMVHETADTHLSAALSPFFDDLGDSELERSGSGQIVRVPRIRLRQLLPTSSTSDARGSWFAHGSPVQVVLGLDDGVVTVAPAGRDVCYFDPNDAELTVQVSAATGTLEDVARAIEQMLAVERSRRLWCTDCGSFGRASGTVGLCTECEDAAHGVLR